MSGSVAQSGLKPEAIARLVIEASSTNCANERRRQIEIGLRGFRQDKAAWGVGMALLQEAILSPTNSHAPHLLLFAANTLLEKIRYDWQDLSASEQQGLRSELLGAVAAAAAHREVKLALRALGASVSALATRCAEQWSDVLISLFVHFGGSETSDGGLHISAEGVLPFLAVLRDLPWECDDGRAGPPKAAKEAMQGQLSAGIRTFCSMMHACFAAAAASVPAAIQCIECLGDWVYQVGVPADILAATPLPASVFGALQQPALFDASVQCVVDMLYAYRDVQRDVAMVTAVVPRVMALQDTFRTAQQNEDEETATGLARIFCACGVSFVPYMLSDAGADDVRMMASAALLVLGHPSPEVRALIINFWMELGKEWVRLPAPQQRSRRDLLSPVMLQAVPPLLLAAAYPTDFDSLGPGDQEELQAERTGSLKFLLNDAVSMSSWKSVLQHLAALLQAQLTVSQAGLSGSSWAQVAQAAASAPENVQQAVQSTPQGFIPGAWNTVEVALWGITCVMRVMAVHEDTVLPVLLRASTLQSLPTHPQLTKAVFSMMSAASRWLVDRCASGDTAPLTDCVQLAMQATRSFAEAGPSATSLPYFRDACLALKDLCAENGQLLHGELLPQLLPLAHRVPMCSGAHVLRATCRLIDCLDSESELVAAMDQVLALPVDTLRSVASQPLQAAAALGGQPAEVAAATQQAQAAGGSAVTTLEATAEHVPRVAAAVQDALGRIVVVWDELGYSGLLKRHRASLATPDSPGPFHPVVQLLSDIWATLDMLAQGFAANVDMQECIARLLKHACYSSQLGFGALLARSLHFVAQQLDRGLQLTLLKHLQLLQEAGVDTSALAKAHSSAGADTLQLLRETALAVSPDAPLPMCPGYVHLGGGFMNQFYQLGDTHAHFVQLTDTMAKVLRSVLPMSALPQAVLADPAAHRRLFIPTLRACTLSGASAASLQGAVARMEAHPEVACDILRLFTKAVTYIPLPFLQSEGAETALHYGLAGLLAGNFHLLAEVHSLWNCVFGAQSPRDSNRQPLVDPGSLRQLTQAKVLPVLPMFVDVFFSVLCSNPVRDVIDSHHCSMAVMWHLLMRLVPAQELVAAVTNSLNSGTMPQGTMTDASLRQFIVDITSDPGRNGERFLASILFEIADLATAALRRKDEADTTAAVVQAAAQQ